MGVGSAKRIRAQALPGQATSIQGGGGMVGSGGSGFWKPVKAISLPLTVIALSRDSNPVPILSH